MNTKRLLVVAFVLVVVALGVLSASTVMSNAKYDAHSGEKWQTDVAAAQSTAQSEGDLVLVYFWSSNCQYCEQFNSDLQNNGALQEAVDRYVLVSARIDEHPDLASQYGVESTPTIIVVTPEGTPVDRMNPVAVDSPANRLEKIHEQETT